MASEATTSTYRVQVTGLWNTRHALSGPDGALGVMTVHRGPWGLIDGGRYEPEQGEVLVFRRDPGLLRSQFSLWTEEREWLGASLRWSFRRREISISTGGKPFRILPLPGFRRGWRLVAPKTGEAARMTAGLLGRATTITVQRRMDLELVLFAYFLGAQILFESLWPGPPPEGAPGALPATREA